MNWSSIHWQVGSRGANHQSGRTIGSPSPLGRLAYATLCARPFVRFFSDLFLFAGAADPPFLEACGGEATPERKWPIIAFNAGLVGRAALGPACAVCDALTGVISK